jgi:hypothetical protein
MKASPHLFIDAGVPTSMVLPTGTLQCQACMTLLVLRRVNVLYLTSGTGVPKWDRAVYLSKYLSGSNREILMCRSCAHMVQPGLSCILFKDSHVW